MNLDISFSIFLPNLTVEFTTLVRISYLFPGLFGQPDEPTLSTQVAPTDGNPTLSSAGVMHSTLLQLRAHIEAEKLERTIPKQLVQRLQRNFTLLQALIELLDQPTASKSLSILTLENKVRTLEKRLSTGTCRYNSRPNSTKSVINHGWPNLPVWTQ